MTPGLLSEDVLDKIMLLFWERGYFNTSIHDLIDATGCNRTALYKHFGGKHGLFLAMVQRFRGKVVVEATLPLSDPEQGMAGIKCFFLQFIQCDLEAMAAHGCFMIATAATLPSDEPEVVEMMEEFLSHLRALFYKNLRWQQAERLLDAALNTEAMADFLVGNVTGLMTLLRNSADAHMIANHVHSLIGVLAGMQQHKMTAHANLHLIS